MNTPDLDQHTPTISSSSSWVAWSVDKILDDPFSEVKKRCFPNSLEWMNIENEWPIYENVVIFSTLPFSREDMLWYSFRDARLNNIIIDCSGQLLKMVLQVSLHSQICPNQSRIKTIEIRSSTGKLLARKFDSYI